MLLAFALMATAAASDWAPVRWPSADPQSLELLQDSPFNCILLEKSAWSLAPAARERGLAVLGVVRASADASAAAAARLDGVVLEGDFEDAAKLRTFFVDSKLTVVELAPRARMRFDARPIVGAGQGVWPGIRAEEDGKTHAAPSGAPWIDTNGGFLRFVRAAAPGAAIWIAYAPPKKTVLKPEHYIQAIADAAIVGARWIVTLDDDLSRRLLDRDARAIADWKRIAASAAWFESHREWRQMKPLSRLAIVQDTDTGALFSGGVLDMIAVKHTPVLPVPTRHLTPEAMAEAKMAVNVVPASLTDAQRESLRAFTRKGGTLLSGPATWKFPQIQPDRITLSDEDVKTLDDIWKEMNSMTGRRNLGARLFNVSSMLSNLLESVDGKTAVLHLVNYSGYPVENVTVHLLGKYTTATLVAPGEPDRKLEVYDNDEGSGVDVDRIGVTATVVLK